MYAAKLPEIATFSKETNYLEDPAPANDHGQACKLPPAEWLAHRVNEPGKTTALSEEQLANENRLHTQTQWENQIARHVLSVYATTKAGTNYHASKAMLSFVDTKRESTAVTVTEFIGKDDQIGRTIRQKKRQTKKTSTEEIGKSLKPVRSLTKLSTANRDAMTNKPWKSSGHIRGEYPNKAPPRPLGADAVAAAIEEQEKLASNNKSSRPTSAPLDSKFHANEFVIRDKHGESLIVRGAPLCAPIWFVSAGDVVTDWSDLPDGTLLQANLSVLYEHRRLRDYMLLLESVLLDGWYGLTNAFEDLQVTRSSQSPTRQSVMKVLTSKTSQLVPGIDYDTVLSRPSSRSNNRVPLSTQPTNTSPTNRNRSKSRSPERNKLSDSPNNQETFASTLPSEICEAFQNTASATKSGQDNKNGLFSKQTLRQWWYRFVVTGNAMAIMLIEKKSYEQAYDLLKRCKAWAENDEILNKKLILELRSYVLDVFAFYYYERKKPQAALEYTEKAMAIHEKLGDLTMVGMGMLHLAAIQCYTGRFKSSHKTLYQFMAMVEQGSLGMESANPTQLCLACIAYHNLAVVQIKLQVSDLACKSSQNARKLAQLCLSQSNRWLPTLQRTHEMAMDDVKFQLSQRKDLTAEQKASILELAQTLYDPAPPV